MNTLLDYDYSSYEQLLSESFQKTVIEANNDQSVNAIYFEYEDLQAHFFLCQRYDTDSESDWAAYWETNIEAPIPDIKIDLMADGLSNAQKALIAAFLDAKICIILAHVISKYKELPVAMAEHDNPILYYQDIKSDRSLKSIFESISLPKEPNPSQNIENVRVFKTPIIIPISVIMVIVLYVGYALYFFTSEQAGSLANLKEISFEIFLMCEFGMISIIFYNKRKLQSFLSDNRVIDSVLTLDKLKPIIRTNMYSALFVFIFLGLGALTAIMAFIHNGIKIGIIVAVLSNLTFMVMKWYAPIEEQAKQIKSSDQLLEKELNDIIHSWMQNVFPKF
ncbi:MAG: hypothetical protein AB8B80_12365 [Marinicellaceae bacterium]